MEKKRLGREAGAGGKGAGRGAPFASVEDLSDESPTSGEAAKLEVPGSRAEGGPPRIDISRASSSSHHEDSSPERELFAGEGGGNVKVGLGFTEDMALELRSSTEELDFHEPEPERKNKKKKLQQQQAVIVTKYDLEAESEKENRERKDSGCSEGGLLYIGGRSSRLSSIGSAASGGSGVSGGSAVSHLSAVSNYSRASRCSSPHRMLLETSFCGPKPIPTLSLEAEYPPSESVEATLLKRKADPQGAILPNCLEVSAAGKPRRTSSERTVRPSPPVVPAVRSSSARAPRKPALKKPNDQDQLVRIIPLHGSLDEPEDDFDQEPLMEEDGRRDDFQPENGGIYIPLKGPIIDTRPERPASEPPHHRRTQEDSKRSHEDTRRSKEDSTRLKEDSRRKKPEVEETDLVRFISLHGDDDDEIQKRNNQSVQFKSWTESSKQYMELKGWPKPRPRSPDPPKPGRLELEKKKNGRSLGQIPRDDSRTPSPASSFSRGNIFRRSSDSSGSSKKSLSSSDSKTKKDSRNKSMFTSLFKKNVKETPAQRSQSEKAPIDPKLTNVEYKFRQDEHVIDQDTIIIPLHSPDEVVEPLIRYDPENPPNDFILERNVPEKKEVKYESQRTSLEVHTIEKNIVVVDVINEDTKDPSVRSEPRTPSEPKKFPREIKKKANELEVYDFEPRVRRSSSICSRETDAIASSREERGEDKEFEKDMEPSVVSKLKEEECFHLSGNVEDKIIVKQESKDESQNRKSCDTDEKMSKSGSEDTCQQTSQETVIENHLVKGEEEARDKSPIHEDILSAMMHDEEIESLIKRDDDSENNITKSESHDKRSSESEVEPDSSKELIIEETDEERKGLFLQTDSLDDELPYVPTTLPQERSVAVPIIPISQRLTEVKTCPVERPRSTTPIQPSNFEEYAAFHEPRPISQEKMQITLPRRESFGKGRVGRGGKGSPPPPLPPRAPQWVAFDEPERRRPPRRITTLPLTYVNPEECTCECHDSQHSRQQPSAPSAHCSKNQHCSPATQPRTDKRYRTADR